MAPEAIVLKATVPEEMVPKAMVPEPMASETMVPEATVAEVILAEATLLEMMATEAKVPEAMVLEPMVPEAAVAEVMLLEAMMPEAMVPAPRGCTQQDLHASPCCSFRPSLHIHFRRTGSRASAGPSERHQQSTDPLDDYDGRTSAPGVALNAAKTSGRPSAYLAILCADTLALWS